MLNLTKKILINEKWYLPVVLVILAAIYFLEALPLWNLSADIFNPSYNPTIHFINILFFTGFLILNFWMIWIIFLICHRLKNHSVVKDYLYTFEKIIAYVFFILFGFSWPAISLVNFYCPNSWAQIIFMHHNYVFNLVIISHIYAILWWLSVVIIIGYGFIITLNRCSAVTAIRLHAWIKHVVCNPEDCSLEECLVDHQSRFVILHWLVIMARFMKLARANQHLWFIRFNSYKWYVKFRILPKLFREDVW